MIKLPQRRRMSRKGEQDDVVVLRHSTSKVLREYDEQMSKIDLRHKSVSELWAQVWKFKEPNDIISYNLRMIQTLIDHQVAEYFQERVQHKNEVKKLLDSPDPAEVEKGQKLKSQYKDDELLDMKMINELTRSLKGLAQEYRSCLLGQKFYMHISNFEKMMLYIKGVLIQEVHNKEILDKIAEKIEVGTKMLTIDVDCKD